MKKAFTVIEALVVVVIISIFVAILYPVFNTAHNRYYNQSASVYFDEVPVFVRNEVYIINGVSRTRPIYRLNSTGATVYNNKPVRSKMASPKYSSSSSVSTGSFGSRSSYSAPRTSSFGGSSSSYRSSSSSSGSSFRSSSSSSSSRR